MKEIITSAKTVDEAIEKAVAELAVDRDLFAKYITECIKNNPNIYHALFIIDADNFKQINDTFGHKEGDFAIKAVAKALEEVCPDGSLFNRFGGDEMLAVCRGKMEPEEVKAAFATYFKEFNEQSEKEYEVEASIGIYITDEKDVLSFEEIIERSDRLMYEEKERHRKKLAGVR